MLWGGDFVVLASPNKMIRAVRLLGQCALDRGRQCWAVQFHGKIGPALLAGLFPRGTDFISIGAGLERTIRRIAVTVDDKIRAVALFVLHRGLRMGMTFP